MTFGGCWTSKENCEHSSNTKWNIYTNVTRTLEDRVGRSCPVALTSRRVVGIWHVECTETLNYQVSLCGVAFDTTVFPRSPIVIVFETRHQFALTVVGLGTRTLARSPGGNQRRALVAQHASVYYKLKDSSNRSNINKTTNFIGRKRKLCCNALYSYRFSLAYYIPSANIESQRICTYIKHFECEG